MVRVSFTTRSLTAWVVDATGGADMGRKRKEIDREQKETTAEELTLELLNEHPDLRDFLLLGVPFPSEFDGKKDE